MLVKLATGQSRWPGCLCHLAQYEYHETINLNMIFPSLDNSYSFHGTLMQALLMFFISYFDIDRILRLTLWCTTNTMVEHRYNEAMWVIFWKGISGIVFDVLPGPKFYLTLEIKSRTQVNVEYQRHLRPVLSPLGQCSVKYVKCSSLE